MKINEIMDMDQRNRRPEPKKLANIVNVVNEIDQFCMDESSPESKKWTERAEELLDSNDADNWNDLNKKDPDAMEDLVTYADELKIPYK